MSKLLLLAVGLLGVLMLGIAAWHEASPWNGGEESGRSGGCLLRLIAFVFVAVLYVVLRLA